MVPKKIKFIRILRKILTVPIYKYINQKIVQKQQSKNDKRRKKTANKEKKRNVQTSERQY